MCNKSNNFDNDNFLLSKELFLSWFCMTRLEKSCANYPLPFRGKSIETNNLLPVASQQILTG